MNRYGFTLIELMLSIMLGSLVVYVAIAGLRVASQSITLANRMALENTVLRTGVVIALDHTDFWTDRDQPNPAVAVMDQTLRGTAPDKSTPPAQRGLPFTPFIVSRGVTGYQPPVSASPAVNAPSGVSPVVAKGLDENASGWDPDSWHAAEARSWSYGNLVERAPERSAPSNRDVPIVKYKTFGHYEYLTSTNPAVSRHHWQQRQLDGLLRSLGSYGMFDYVPPNIGHMIYEQVLAGQEQGQWYVSKEFCSNLNGPDYRLMYSQAQGSNDWSFASDRFLKTWGFSFQVPSRTVAPANRAHVANRHYAVGIRIEVDYNTVSVNGLREMLLEGEAVDAVLHDGDPSNYTPANKPAHWPGLEVRTLRFLRSGAFVNLNQVIWTNPLTGKGAQLNFTAFGTTLRGARQQRLRDEPGWADPFPDSGAPKPHLDSY